MTHPFNDPRTLEAWRDQQRRVAAYQRSVKRPTAHTERRWIGLLAAARRFWVRLLLHRTPQPEPPRRSAFRRRRV